MSQNCWRWQIRIWVVGLCWSRIHSPCMQWRSSTLETSLRVRYLGDENGPMQVLLMMNLWRGHRVGGMNCVGGWVTVVWDWFSWMLWRLTLETFLRGKYGRYVFCIIKSQLFFWHAFLQQLMNLTPPPLTWLAFGGWRWLIHQLVMNLFGRRHRVGDESSCGWLGYVGVGFSCMPWRLTTLSHSWGICERKCECPSFSLIQGVFCVAIKPHGWHLGWRWLYISTGDKLVWQKKSRVGDESRWLGYVGVGFSCMHWRSINTFTQARHFGEES